MPGAEEDPSEYDVWLFDRLTLGQDRTWLGDHYAATTTCGLVGTALMGLKSAVLSDSRLQAQALNTGFPALQPDVETFRATLDALVARADGPLAAPQKAFGLLYSKFARDLAENVEFAPFRTEVRECVLAHWYYAAGEVLLRLRTRSGS